MPRCGEDLVVGDGHDLDVGEGSPEGHLVLGADPRKVFVGFGGSFHPTDGPRLWAVRFVVEAVDQEQRGAAAPHPDIGLVDSVTLQDGKVLWADAGEVKMTVDERLVFDLDVECVKDPSSELAIEVVVGELAVAGYHLFAQLGPVVSCQNVGSEVELDDKSVPGRYLCGAGGVSRRPLRSACPVLNGPSGCRSSSHTSTVKGGCDGNDRIGVKVPVTPRCDAGPMAEVLTAGGLR